MQNISNLWRSSSKMKVDAACLDKDLIVDLAIIGGGFTGCSAALEAARRGAKVALFEGDTFGHGGSGRNVGLVNAGLCLPPEDVIKEMGQEPGYKLMSALAAAPARVWSLIEREGIDCEATPHGTLHLAHSAGGLGNLVDRHRQGQNVGWPIELLDARETAQRTGSAAFHGALFDPRAGTIQPLSYARGLAQAAIRAGGKLHEQSRVERVRRDGDVWLLTVQGHQVRAKALLLATNAYFDGIDMGFRPEIVAMSYFQMATAPMPARLREKILPEGEGCWDTALVMSSFRIDRAGRMIIGAIGNLGAVGRSAHVSWASRKLRQVYPQLAGLPFEHAWYGRIAMTHDHIPKIVAFGPNAFACFGYSGRGIGPGTTFGTLSAIALLEDDETVLPVKPVDGHNERAVPLREAYMETGAVLTHMVNPLPFV